MLTRDKALSAVCDGVTRWLATSVWLLALALLAVPGVARSFEIVGKNPDFSMQLEAKPNERLCIIVPEGREDAGCDGIEPAQRRKLRDSVSGRKTETVAFVILRREELFSILHVQREGSPFDPETEFKKVSEGFIEGLLGATKGGADSQEVRLISLADRKAAEIDVRLRVVGDDPVASLFGYVRAYLLPVGSVTYVLSFSAPRSEERWASGRARELLDSLEAAKPVSSAFRKGQAVGRVVGMLSIVLVAALVVVWLVRKQRAQARARQTGWGAPPGGWSAQQGAPTWQPGWHPGPQGPAYGPQGPAAYGPEQGQPPTQQPPPPRT